MLPTANPFPQGIRRAETPKSSSWAFVTAYKAASSYAGLIIKSLLEERGVACIDLAAEAFAKSEPEGIYCVTHQSMLTQENTLYGPFRDYYIKDMPALAKTNIIVHLRDPRDCLVSNYYSMAYGHTLPGEGPVRDQFIADREKIRNMSVDEYVLDDCANFEAIFIALNDVIEKMPNVYVSYYEEMVRDFSTWLEYLSHYLGTTGPSERKESIVRTAKFDVTENQFNHMRQVTPGDFMRKLSPATQLELTRRMEGTLRSLGYLRN